jgi:hypothetical protein
MKYKLDSLIEDIYKNYHDTDGFLYIQYSEMVTFGWITKDIYIKITIH